MLRCILLQVEPVLKTSDHHLFISSAEKPETESEISSDRVTSLWSSIRVTNKLNRVQFEICKVIMQSILKRL